MIAKISLRYGAKLERIEQLEILRKYDPEAELVDKKEGEDQRLELKDAYRDLIVDINDFVKDLPNLHFEFRGLIPNTTSQEHIKHINNKFEHIQEIVVNIVDKLERIQNTEKVFNEKCNVHLPGLGLLSINEVMLLEDSCTDTLQDYIGSGWRIISVCPQPDQRRPDYILGRTNNDINK
jgi:hypothetical protein